MKIDRDKLLEFLKEKQLLEKPITSPIDFINCIVDFLEKTQSNVQYTNSHNYDTTRRFQFSTIGYGVMNLMGQRYRMGRIEVYDTADQSPFAVHEGSYILPFNIAAEFEDFIDSIETDLPICIKIGSYEWCENECANDLGFDSVDKMNDPSEIKQYHKNLQEEYAQKRGYSSYKDYQEYLSYIFTSPRINHQFLSSSGGDGELS